MFKFLLPLFAAILFVSPIIRAQDLVDDRQISLRSNADVVARRQTLINIVWGKAGMPYGKLPRLPVTASDTSPVPGLSNLDRVDTLIVDMEADVKSYAHHFIPRVRNQRLVILHTGHVSTFNDSDVPADEGHGMRRTIDGLLADGFSVLAVYMPRNVSFNTSLDVSDDGGLAAHDQFFLDAKYRPTTGSPLKYFLEPVTVYLNYLSSRSAADNFPVYRDYSMVGFSGGGWTTTVYSALDTRIKKSISVAGSLPLYLRSGPSIGDLEQTTPEFYSVAGYPDLYVMGSDGPGRRQIQILNRQDWCCFSEIHHDRKKAGGASFDEAISEVEGNVREVLLSLGNKDLFSIEIDEAAPGHNVTWDAIYDTILPEISDGHRDVATATGDEAIARDVRGTPAVFMNGIWSPSKLPAMMGTPALLKGGVNIYDMFYRTAANRLVHVYRPPLTWSRPRVLLDKAIADPAAVSIKPGTFDVVVLGTDYKVHHIHRSGSQITETIVSDHVKGLGQLTLIASAPDRLDLFYRSWNRRLYHARKIGNAEWIVDDVGGQMTDFPTAVRMADGGFKAFVRGRDGRLWTSERGPVDSSEWSGWQRVSGNGSIEGSPSAAVVNGKLNVFVRTNASNIRRFVLGDSWSATENAGSYTGSPTASSNGIFSRDSDGSLNYSDGISWVDLGGSLE